MNPFAECLVANLKSLNAKEREYLVRYAYQGAREAKECPRPWLSKDMVDDLKKELPALLGPNAECVFAGMDYHLDWLHAALLFACDSMTVDLAQSSERVEPLGGKGDLDKSLRPVTGGQEDVDLLAVFVDGEAIVVLFIEAKGVGSIDTHQLARKLIRLSRIVEESGASRRPDIKFMPVWVSPSKPGGSGRETLWDYGRKAARLEGYLPAKDVAVGLGHESPIPYLALAGFSKDSMKKVTRMNPDAPNSDDFTHWKITNR